jgi:hypothetical protein
MTIEHESAPVMAPGVSPGAVRTADTVSTNERVSTVRPAADGLPVARDLAPPHVHCSGYNVWA